MEIMDNHEYWINYWNKSALENVDIRFISGWGNRTFQEMLLFIADTANKLKLNKEDNLLDIGCGAGLFEIAFSPFVNKIVGIDSSIEMINKAEANTLTVPNAYIMYNPTLDYSKYDKVLISSVIQYFNNIYEIYELIKSLKYNNRILISIIPDVTKKEEYLKGYEDLNLSGEELKQKLEVNNHCLWFSKEELKEIAEIFNFKVTFLEPINEFHKKYYFDMLLTK